MQPVKIHIYSQSRSSEGTENIETTAYGRLAEKIINFMFLRGRCSIWSGRHENYAEVGS